MNHADDTNHGLNRRSILMTGAAMAATGAIPQAWAQGSDKPEKEEVRIGFIPLTDCASVVMASVLGFDKKYGIKIVPTKEASWAGVRDKLVNGEVFPVGALGAIQQNPLWRIDHDALAGHLRQELLQAFALLADCLARDAELVLLQ